MKWIFLAVLAALCLASLGMFYSMPDRAAGKPVIYWVTDRNPARNEQVALFHEWMARTHPDVEVELRLDMGNSEKQKKVVQGVSGVAGDVMDQTNGSELRYFRALGLNTDITEPAQARGFGVDTTFEALREDLSILGPDGQRRQYQFPCNVANSRYFANLEVFEKLGMDPPPERWTLEEFERIGKEYVRRVNDGNAFGDGRRRFFANIVEPHVLMRSMGVDLFNETLTGPGMDMRIYTPEGLSDTVAYAETLSLIYKWTYLDRITPTPADLANLSTGAGYGGSGIQAFVRGDFGLFDIGRWGLIQFRTVNKEQRVSPQDYPKFADGVLDEAERAQILAAGRQLPLRLGSCEPPHLYLPNVRVGTRAAMVYSGSDDKDLALYFLEFLASPEYNAQIIRDADGLPPVPAYAAGEAYLTPEVDPARGVYAETEHGVHEAMLRDVQTIAITGSYSPFVLFTVIDTEFEDYREVVMNDLRGADEAAAMAAARARRRFDEALSRLEPDDPRRALYAEWSEDQQTIDALKTRGAKIPASLIRNPFYLTYYESIGMLEHDVGPDATAAAN